MYTTVFILCPISFILKRKYINFYLLDYPFRAGVGRTGTFIAIETGLRQVEHDQTVDVYGTVCRMRMQRNFMVQIEAQYTFIYDALLDR